jgi:hypothetical protein
VAVRLPLPVSHVPDLVPSNRPLHDFSLVFIEALSSHLASIFDSRSSGRYDNLFDINAQMASKRTRAAFEADFQAQQSPYAFYGTPLPALDAGTRDDGSYVPVWKQEVTDDRGRKRLHGAFTGGFSAG